MKETIHKYFDIYYKYSSRLGKFQADLTQIESQPIRYFPTKESAEKHVFFLYIDNLS